jgi:hypothetical protein
MNPITVFLTVACLAVGAGLGATGHLYAEIPVVIAAIVIASALKMANTWQKFVILRASRRDFAHRQSISRLSIERSGILRSEGR